jgi:hypothetical protein
MKNSLLFAAGLFVAPALAFAQTPRVYTPDTPPRADEMTLLNTAVIAIDRQAATITVRVDKQQGGVVDRARTETFPLDPAVAKSASDVKAGANVLITLRGRTVVGLKLSVPSAAAGAATSRTPAPAPRVTPRATAPVATPVEPTAPAQVVVPGQPLEPPTAIISPVPGVPSPAPAGTPFPTPRPVPTPQSPGTPIPVGTPKPVGTPPVVGTPRPVLVPTEPPPTTLPSPSPTPTPPPVF